MKTFKILIVAVVIAALGFGTYKIFAPSPVPPNPNGKIVIPEECDLDWAQDYIDSAYRIIPNGQFLTLKHRRGEMKKQFDETMSGTPKKCRETIDLILRNRYQSRFIQMADTEFAAKDWPNYSDIKDINSALLTELSHGSSDLERIDKVCKEYGRIISYNAQVIKQSKQRPSTLWDHWDHNKTSNLINNVPSASSPVNHTTQYESSRIDNVKSKLYNGHVAFLDEMVKMAKNEIQNNPTKDYYNRACEIVSKEIEQFKNKASVYSRSNSAESKANDLNKLLDGYEKDLNVR